MLTKGTLVSGVGMFSPFFWVLCPCTHCPKTCVIGELVTLNGIGVNVHVNGCLSLCHPRDGLAPYLTWHPESALIGSSFLMTRNR